MKASLLGWAVLSPLLVVACGDSLPQAPVPPQFLVADSGPPGASTSTASAFSNPGGMWMPHQMSEHAPTLRRLGLAVDPSELSLPTGSTLGAVVSLGGCSASFVSPDGLIATNHHCATRALQHNSTPAENLLREGFLANTRGAERSNGPLARVYVTRSMTQVTRDVLGAADAASDSLQRQHVIRQGEEALARHSAIEAKQKALTADCEKAATGVRCSVVPFYGGAEYYLVEQLEIRDVRLVYAPAASIGNYGGEVDNWRWPRHTGDFAFFRAYVGKDGKPADHAKENVPYRPAHHLRLARDPVRVGDLVMVAGYPARTQTAKTLHEVRDAVEHSYPRRLKFCEAYIPILEQLAARNKDVGIKGASLLRGLHNARTNIQGQLEGFAREGLVDRKRLMEARLRSHIESDPSRAKKYEGVLDEMARIFDRRAQERDADADLRELVSMSRLLEASVAIVRMAGERTLKDEQRHPDFQSRNWPSLRQYQQSLERSYHADMDRALMALALRRIASGPDGKKSRLLPLVLGKDAPSDENIRKAVEKLFAATKLAPADVRATLLEKGSRETLRVHPDPMMRLAVQLTPLVVAAERRDHELVGDLSRVMPRYLEAMRDLQGAPIAPDANSTLRVTFGTVKGYRPKADAPESAAFTLLPEVAAKSTGKEPFDAPERLLAAIRNNLRGPYVDSRLGDVPVDFLADLHITGGNSGSATLNGKGEFVGLVFDGNYEALVADWLFLPSITRSIHVDLRYMLWVMDAVDHADGLLAELGITPSFPRSR